MTLYVCMWGGGGLGQSIIKFFTMILTYSITDKCFTCRGIVDDHHLSRSLAGCYLQGLGSETQRRKS